MAKKNEEILRELARAYNELSSNYDWDASSGNSYREYPHQKAYIAGLEFALRKEEE